MTPGQKKRIEAALAGLTGSPAQLEGYDALRGELERTKRERNGLRPGHDSCARLATWISEHREDLDYTGCEMAGDAAIDLLTRILGERDAANRDADTYRQILAGKMRRTDLAAAQNGDLMPGPLAVASLILADMIEAKPEAKNRLGWSWTDERTGKAYRVMVEHENGESFGAAIATARVDGARGMREAAASVCDRHEREADSVIVKATGGWSDRLHQTVGKSQATNACAKEIRALDPATVGSGS